MSIEYSAAVVKEVIGHIETITGIKLEYRKGNAYVCHRVDNAEGNIRIEITANTKRELIEKLQTFKQGLFAMQDIIATNKGSK